MCPLERNERKLFDLSSWGAQARFESLASCPVDLGMAEYCDACRVCIKVCPTNRFGYEACMDAFRKEGKILR